MLAIRQLEVGDNLLAFRCGNEDLDSWLKKHGLENQHLYGVTYLAFDGEAIVGFVTVSSSMVDRQRIGRGGPRTWPVLLLGRMAVAKERQGQGIGEHLLMHVFNLAAQQYRQTGCAAVVVDAKPEAVAFYQKRGFKPMRFDPHAPSSPQTQMYVALKSVLAKIDDT